MGTIWIKEFTGGLDTRRMPETTSGGVLIKASNGHISRGGDFEKRPAFVEAYEVPDGQTTGLANVATGLVVFGDGPAPTMPQGVSYQRLQHPDGVTSLSRVLSFDIYAGKLYVAAEFVDGSVYHFYDGVRVAEWVDGRARASFRVIGGDNTSSLTNITVNGVAIISGSVTWSTSNSVTAANIASAINSFTSTPDYTATAVGDRVNIIAATPGTGPNGTSVVVTVASGMVISPASGITMAGGTTASGTFQPGGYVKTYGSRELSVSGTTVFGSGIQQPTEWTTDTVGAFFIDMTTQASNVGSLKAISEYQNLVAIFAEQVILVWYFDSDPANNRKSQVLRNTGTSSPRSVTQFGDNDLFYCDESGVRSLRARDASNSAATTDIGVPVDTIISAKLQTLTETERAMIIGLIEPRDGRFWLIAKDTIYVFSFFPGSKVSAWSTYSPGFDITDAVVFNRRVYVRSGDKIYAFGGQGNTTQYDETVAEAWLPYLDGNAPTVKKMFTGIDAAVEGSWQVFAAMDPNDEDAEDKVAEIYETTYPDHRIPAGGEATHISLRFRSKGPGAAKLGASVIHYQGEPPDED